MFGVHKNEMFAFDLEKKMRQILSAPYCTQPKNNMQHLGNSDHYVHCEKFFISMNGIQEWSFNILHYRHMVNAKNLFSERQFPTSLSSES